MEDEYVYLINFDIDNLKELNLSKIVPVNAIENFEHIINISKTLEMKTIHPYS